ncbi:MAG: hypothetical protein ACXV5Q_03190 [Frankiaceae bacterium]
MASGLDRQQGAASPQPGKSDKDEGLQLSFIQVLASALAAASGAIVTSAFGVAGTIAGAAVMSLIATSATAVYSHSIKRTSRMLRQPLHPDAGQRSTAGAGYGGPTGGGYGPSAAGGYGGPASVYGRPADAGYGRPASGGHGRSAAAGDAAPAGGQHDPGGALGAEGAQGAERSASDQPPADAARPGYTAPRTYGQGRRLNRKVGLALGIVLTFVIALGTLTIIELITGKSSAGLWGQGGNGPSIIGGGDTSAPSPKPTAPASSPTYTGSPTPTSTSTPSPTSTATPSATPSPTATPAPTRTTSPTATSSPQLRAPSPTPRVASSAASR